jgi:ABC-2 type transport system permease protein
LAALYYPAASLIEEREQRTIDALLVSPVQMGDVLAAKGAVAALLAVAMSLITLALNGALGSGTPVLILVLAVGSVMLAEAGVLLGLWAKDANTMMTAIKGGGIIIFLPVVFVIWPNLPQWIPRLVPTYYFLQPVFEVGVLGAGLGDVWLDVLVAAACCVVLAPLVVAYGRRVERRLGMLT